jgi:hypothetical protein
MPALKQRRLRAVPDFLGHPLGIGFIVVLDAPGA